MLLYRYTQISRLSIHSCFGGYILANIFSMIPTKELEKEGIIIFFYKWEY